jgi:hypothetical protein
MLAVIVVVIEVDPYPVVPDPREATVPKSMVAAFQISARTFQNPRVLVSKVQG